ncbi:alpha/beta fold hydrolase [Micromonospora sp. WMMD1102]|uniref:thioesterase II family protein n=1 Tax=Micromonospora sp. WMMD1102 TaxID=3016105 RepID=UPI0024153A99|nr:alpha/beta fold hydrolase [Micromonospora sp. WMMD1102]MDG4789716.1 alpha/beta fold hydrolase [Micromonospora sp. WMMD1102]
MASTTPATGYGPWFNYVVRRRKPRLRLLCLAGAGSGPSEFARWGEALPETVEVWPVQLPGREQRMREAPWSDLELIVAAVATALDEAVDPSDTPLVCFGHSFGALVMFEWCQRIQADARATVAGLMVCGLAAPGRPGGQPGVAERNDADLLAWIGELGGTPHELLKHSWFTDWLVRDVRTAYQIRGRYDASRTEPLSCSIVAFGGADDFETSDADLDAWAEFTRSRFRRHTLPGGHFFVRDSRDRLLTLVREELEALA